MGIQDAKVILFPETYLYGLNREDFVEIFAQNTRVIGGNTRFFSTLVYSRTANTSLLPVTANSRLLTIPVGQGFRIALSRYEKQLASYAGKSDSRNVRATRRAFIRIIEAGKNRGFRLSDITLSRGNSEIVSVRNDSTISEEMYGKYSEDPLIVPTYLGFSNGESTVAFDIELKISCFNYQTECGDLIFDAVMGVLEEEPLYRSLESAFVSKKDDTWVSAMNPVHVPCAFGDSDELLGYLESSFSGLVDFSIFGRNGISFSSGSGIWGNLLISDGGVDIFFKSTVDFVLGIWLVDILAMVRPQ